MRKRRGLPVLPALVCLLGATAPVRAADSPAPLALETAVATALRQHPSLEVARQRTLEASGRADQQRSVAGFNADLTVSGQRYDWLPPNKRNILGGGSTDVYTDVRVQKLLYSGGRVGALVRAADRSFQASSEGERRTQQAVVFEVTRAFYRVAEAEGIAAARAEAVERMEQHAQLARDLLKVGKAPRVDVLRAEVKLADVKQTLIRSRNALSLARLALNNAMGLPADQPIALNPDLALPQPPPTAAAALEAAFRQRPEWRQSGFALEKGEAEVAAARAERLPAVSLVGSYNLEGSTTPSVDNWNVGLVLSLPLLDSGRIRAAAGQARARRDASEAEQELLRQRITLEVTTALLNLQEALERAGATEAAAAEARESLTIERERYRLGMSTSVDVFDVQVSLTQAEVNHTQALVDARIAAAQVAFATGTVALEASPQVKNTGMNPAPGK